MQGDGIFSDQYQDFSEFLSREGTNAELLKAFVARNFLLDEGVLRQRAASYRDADAAQAHASYEAWVTRHNHYLETRVRVRGRGGPRPATLDIGDPDGCAETFRYVDTSSPFLYSDGSLHLVRVETVDSLAMQSHEPPDSIRDLVQRVVKARDADAAACDALTDILARWAGNCDLRPVFAGYWQNVEKLFGVTPDGDSPGWADVLRDRLGLYHLNPLDQLQPVPVIVFRYPISDVPRWRGKQYLRPLVPPTVLDGSHSPAFCPAPRGSKTGHTVDLSQRGDSPCCEVLHPPLEFRSEHVWREGVVTRAVSTDDLASARQWHILCIRQAAGRNDYAAGTNEGV